MGNNIQLTPHSNFSFETLDQGISNKDLNRSLFNGTLLTNKIDTVIFTNADFEGTRFSNTEVVNSSFKEADIRSIWCAETTFLDTDFSDAGILDCTFVNCTFENCSFKLSTIQNCNFNECKLINCNLENSTVLINKFINCEFNHMIFQKTFYFAIFEDCKFTDIIFEAYLLGFVYGLSDDNLSELQMLVMEVPVSMTKEQLRGNILEIYNSRFMYMNMGLLELNLGTANREEALSLCLAYIIKCIENNLIIKKEEIDFLKIILESLSSMNELSPYLLLYFIKQLEMILKLEKNQSLEKASSKLMELKNSLYFRYQSYLDCILKNIPDWEFGEIVTVTAIYKERPALELIDVVRDFSIGQNAPVLIENRIGSFVQCFEMVSELIPILNLFVGMASAVIPIFINKYNISRENKRIAAAAQEEQEKQLAIASSGLIEITNKDLHISINPGILKNETSINTVIDYITDNNLKASNQYKGHGCRNVIKITIQRSA